MRGKIEKFLAAAIQPEMIAGNPERNIERVMNLTQGAAAKGAKVIVLPELFITGFDYECIRRFPARRTAEVLRRLRSMARENQAVIVAGSVSVLSSGQPSAKKLYNVSYLIGTDGRTRAHYEKMHLFPLLHEDVHFTAGTDLVCVPTQYGAVAPCVCFDIRFPELTRRIMHLGAHLLAVPAEFPHPRLEHWRILLRARAIENQFYVVAANRVGRDSTGSYFGHSMIINPLGEVVAEAGEDEGALLGPVDVGEVESVRRALPCLDRINPAVGIEARKRQKKIQ